MKSLFKTMLKIAIVCLPTLLLGTVQAESFQQYSNQTTEIAQANEGADQPEGAANPAESEDEDALIRDLQDKIENLRSQLDDLSQRGDDLEAEILEVTNLPTEEYLADSNLVLKGIGFVDFIAQHHANETFRVNIFPRFLWRYRDRILVDSQWIFTSISGGSFIVETCNIAYVINDYLIVRAGLMYTDIGLGIPYRLLPWIYKFASINPIAFTATSSPFPLLNLGVDLRGSIPLACCSGEGGIPPVLFYSLWVGNGPGEFFGDINNQVGIFGGADDNNHEKAVGGRLGIRRLFNEFSVSGMWGRWNNNALGQLTNLTGLPPEVVSTKNLNFAILAADFDILICHNYRIMGEYYWTRRDAVPNPFLGITRDVIYERSGYLQGSAFLMDLPFFGSCCEWPDYMNDFEIAFQYSFLDSDKATVRRKEQWLFGLSYYLDPTTVVRASYAISRGRFNKDNIFAATIARAF